MLIIHMIQDMHRSENQAYAVLLLCFQHDTTRACSKLVISVTEHLVEVVDKLSTTAVVFFRSERILKCMHLYGA